jgi:hypothetical protein
LGLKEFEGETSSRGVKFVLGPKSFRQLELEASIVPQFVNLIKESVEQCRRLLNWAAQIGDESVRTKVRQSVLHKEVEELELAIRAFSQKYPAGRMPSERYCVGVLGRKYKRT